MEKGLIHIYCGDGKGKTTAAMGLAIRAAGREKKVFITQFLKSGKSGELVSLEKLKEYIVNNSNFEIVEIKNYLEDGHPEDPNYKALHIRMKYQKFPCEVEFMDIKMFEHVARTHTDYKKGLLK